ncbi:MAG: PHB depolymerase family esterase [Oxalobacteraceae bacterium]
MKIHRICNALLAALLTLAFCASPSQAAGRFISDSSDWTNSGYLSSPYWFNFFIFPIRDYRLYVPSDYRSGSALPLVVMLHGCKQDPVSFAAGTRMNALAEQKKFFVLYPKQGITSNADKCWNWFDGATQHKAGEAAIISGMVKKIKSEYSIDADRVYVAGLSAGAGMASILASCYSDVFAAAAIHSGPEYEAADYSNAAAVLTTAKTTPPAVAGRDAYRCSGSAHRAMPVIVFHGSSDQRIIPVHAEQVIRQFAQMNDYADDGANNNSVPAVATSHVTMQPAGHHAYTVYDYRYGGQLLLQKYVIDGMAHKWSGGQPINDDDYYDPLGPDATALIWEFFNAHGR